MLGAEHDDATAPDGSTGFDEGGCAPDIDLMGQDGIEASHRSRRAKVYDRIRSAQSGQKGVRGGQITLHDLDLWKGRG
jgi:hypothetical protein